MFYEMQMLIVCVLAVSWNSLLISYLYFFNLYLNLYRCGDPYRCYRGLQLLANIWFYANCETYPNQFIHFGMLQALINFTPVFCNNVVTLSGENFDKIIGKFSLNHLVYSLFISLCDARSHTILVLHAF